MTTLAAHKNSDMKTPYSLRRYRNNTETQVGSPGHQSNVEQQKQQTGSITSFHNLINQEQDSDDEEHDHEENIDFIDNIAIYSFSDMHKLKNFYEQNQLKLAGEKKSKSKESESDMNKYLKKLDDTIESNYKQSEVLVWQPNIKKTQKTQSDSKIFRSHSVASDSISMGSTSELLPECGKAHCKLGCICETLTHCEYPSDSDSSNNDRTGNGNGKYERGHCGLIDCMFVCNCSRKLRNRETAKPDKSAVSEEINLRTRKNKKRQQQARRKSQEAADANRRISKRLKTSICKLNKKTNKANSNKKSNKKSTASSSSPSKKSKSILNKSNATSIDYSLDNADESSSEEGESSHTKQDGYRTGIFSDTHQDKEEEEEVSNEQGCATRKSKRVKILNKKFNNDENVAHLPLNEFYYYSNKSLKSKNNKVLNNRVNENFGSATSSSKKDKIQKLGKKSSMQKSAKKLKESTTNSAQFQADFNENSMMTPSRTPSETIDDFKPYTKNFTMKITNSVNSLDSHYSKSQPSTSNSSNSYYTSVPLAIKCYTSIWESDAQLRMQVLKKIAKLLQRMACDTDWSHFDFDYEALSIKLVNAQPVLVKVYKRKLQHQTIEDGENENILSLNDLVSTSLKIRSKLYSDKEESLKVKSEPLTCPSSSQQQYYSKFESLHLNTKPGSRPLPRLIIRKRTSKPIDQTQQTNKTGVLLKQVDNLFQQMKSNGTFPTIINNQASIASKRIDTFDTISKSVLNMRLHSVNSSQLVKSQEDLLFRDEISYFSKHIANKETSLVEYPFYNPFSDEDLVLGMYREHGSRVLVDTVCDMVNDMITACCKLEEKLTDEKMSKPPKQISQFVKPNIIRSRPTILNNGRVPVALTAIKKKELSKSPSPENISSTPKNNLVYKIINSSSILKNTNPNGGNTTSSNGPPNVLCINKPTVGAHDKGIENNSHNGARLPQLSTVQLERTESLENDVTSESETTSTPVEAPVSAERQLQITGIKTILPSSKSSLNYKTLVKIVAPEKNNPEGIPKIKISSSYLMPAKSCFPKPATTIPKLITMPLKSPTQMNSNLFSSFIPITKPTNQDEAPTTNFKSIVTVNNNKTLAPSAITRPAQQPETTKFTLTNNYSLNNQAVYQPRQPNTMITQILPNTSKMMTIDNTQQVDSSSDSNSVIEIEKQVYLENRKRKRKQDLSSLKSLNNYLNDSQYDERVYFNPDDLVMSREVTLRTNQLEDGSFFFRPQYNAHEFSPAKKQCTLNRFDSGNNSAFRSSSFTPNRNKIQNQHKGSVNQNNMPKNFSSSPDSNESLYSSSTPLPFENNRYEKSTLIQYREDSDDNEYAEENNFYQLHGHHSRGSNNNNKEEEDGEDNDVIEIESFDSTNKQDCYNVDDDYWRLESSNKDTDIRDSDDSDDESLGRVTFSTKGMERSTVNNIHSIRERQRRLKLKNLLMKLKIQLFEAESDSKYDLDNSESQIRLDEYCNTRNFKKTSLKSKQNILQEAVNLIKKLQDQQVLLEHMRRKEKLELEKNIGIKNYLLSLQNK